MVFTPPALHRLSANTKNLDIKFSTLIGIYRVADASEPNTLAILMKRTKKVLEYKPDNPKRRGQREVIEQLCNELRELSLSEDQSDLTKENIQRATLFLLGALLHRYFRILKEYDNQPYNRFFKLTYPHNSDLFQAIREAIHLTHSVTLSDYRERDLEILDPLTVVDALQMFQNNMLSLDEKGLPRYSRYPHFRDDSNFQPYLAEIIKEHIERGWMLKKQFQAIYFIQSLEIHIKAREEEISEALGDWGSVLATVHPDFKALNKEQIVEHLNSYYPETNSTKKSLSQLLHTPVFAECLPRLATHEEFVEQMKEIHRSILSYTLLGGYILVLGAKESDERLRYSLQLALEIEKTPSVLDDKVTEVGIGFFERYEKDNPDLVLNYEFFNGKYYFAKHLAECKMGLAARAAAHASCPDKEVVFLTL